MPKRKFVELRSQIQSISTQSIQLIDKIGPQNYCPEFISKLNNASVGSLSNMAEKALVDYNGLMAIESNRAK